MQTKGKNFLQKIRGRLTGQKNIDPSKQIEAVHDIEQALNGNKSPDYTSALRQATRQY